MNSITVLLLSLYCAFATPLPVKPTPAPTKVVVKMTDIRSSSGCLRLGIYKDQESFKNEKPFLKQTAFKNRMVGGVVEIEFNLEPGTYGIALLDDEDSDGDMDYGFILPDEGFGFSNYYHTGFSKPTLSKFSFNIADGKTTNVTIKVKYM